MTDSVFINSTVTVGDQSITSSNAALGLKLFNLTSNNNQKASCFSLGDMNLTSQVTTTLEIDVKQIQASLDISYAVIQFGSILLQSDNLTNMMTYFDYLTLTSSSISISSLASGIDFKTIALAGQQVVSYNLSLSNSMFSNLSSALSIGSRSYTSSNSSQMIESLTMENNTIAQIQGDAINLGSLSILSNSSTLGNPAGSISRNQTLRNMTFWNITGFTLILIDDTGTFITDGEFVSTLTATLCSFNQVQKTAIQIGVTGMSYQAGSAI